MLWLTCNGGQVGVWEDLHVLLRQDMAGLDKALVVVAEAWDRLEVLGHYYEGQNTQVMDNTTSKCKCKVHF